MFQKPFRVKSQTSIKGSDRKKVRAAVGISCPDLTTDELNQLIPAKDEMTVTKIYTHSGDTTVIYNINQRPAFFELDKRLFPTVYTLWNFPEMLPRFTTWPALLKKFQGGADLMLPGVIVDDEVTPYTFKHINKADTCSINLIGNKAPVAVGKAAMSGSDMFESGMKGKGVLIMHVLGDELWAFGDKSKPPEISEEAASDVKDEVAKSDKQGEDSSENSCLAVAMETKDETDNHCEGKLTDTTTSESLSVNVSNGFNVVDRLEGVNISDNATGLEDDTSEVANEEATGGHILEADNVEVAIEDEVCSISPADEMDSLLEMCFKCAIKSSLKKSDLPILTSAFYKQHMVPFCPNKKSLDLKKSRYKKLSKFLQHMEREEYIKVKELSKGVDSIIEFDKSHKELRNFSVPEIEPETKTSSLSNETASGSRDFIPPKITELFTVTAALVPLVKMFGHSKGSPLTTADIRTIITEYVKQNSLQDENNKRYVQLDPLLADIVLSRGEGNTTHMVWEDLLSKVLEKAQPAFSVAYPDQEPVIHKGKMEGIKLRVEQRASNKKVTFIENLETFGIDPSVLAHQVQIKVACSTSITQHPQKGKGQQVLVQGNQLHFLADLLLDKYQIPRKYVLGLEKMPKSKKKR